MFFMRSENMVRKEENAGYQHFLFFNTRLKNNLVIFKNENEESVDQRSDCAFLIYTVHKGFLCNLQ